MTMMYRLAAISLVCLQQSTLPWGFAPSSPSQTTPQNGVHSSSFHWHLNYNPNDNPFESYTNDIPPFSEYESDSSRKQRMDMVRKLRKSFYAASNQSEDHSKLPGASPNMAYGSSVIRHLPVLTTQDVSEITSTEFTAMLPGYQYVWNIHSIMMSDMFHSILAREGPWFFACLSDYEFGGPRYATLMRITDHRFEDEDGRIVLAVQAMDRLKVLQLSSPHMTFQNGDFQIWPEIELVREKLKGAFPEPDKAENKDITETADPKSVSQAAISASAAESFRCRNFEYAPVYLTKKPKGPSDIQSLHNNPNDSKATQLIKAGIRKQNEENKAAYETDYLNVIELVSYDAIAYQSLIDPAAVNSQAIKNFWTNLASEEQQESIFVDEEELFSDLGKSSVEFKQASFTIESNQKNTPLPDFDIFANAPSNEGVIMMEYHLWKSLDELIRLINNVSTSPGPVPVSSQLMALLPKRNDWPEDFVLDEYCKSMLSHTGPIVRIDEITKQSRSSVYDSTGYSSLRRALRLSHAVWLLLDGLAVSGADPPPPTRAEILAMESIFERLKVAKSVLDGVIEVLKRLIPYIKKKDGDTDSDS